MTFKQNLVTKIILFSLITTSALSMYEPDQGIVDAPKYAPGLIGGTLERVVPKIQNSRIYRKIFGCMRDTRNKFNNARRTVGQVPEQISNFTYNTVSRTASGTAHAIINALNNPDNSQALTNAVNTLFNSTSQAVQQQFAENGNSSQAIQNFLNAVVRNLGNLWGEEGEGQQAMNNFLNMIQRAMRDGGEISHIIRNAFSRNQQIIQEIGNAYQGFGDLFREGGQAHQAFGQIQNAVNDTFTGRNGLLGQALSLTTNYYLKFAGIGILSYLGTASAWYGSKWFWEEYMKWWLKKPRVIIESSKSRSWLSKLLWKIDLPDMIFNQELKTRLEGLITTTKNVNARIKEGKKNVKYRNLLLWGPPGTGKTMFAKQLAQKSGMDWVMVTGSSFFQKNAGIKSIDELFHWAEKSKKGLLIFIDEADSLLPDRTKLEAGTENYQIVNHFLNWLGTRSQKFMVVMSTNHKAVFDSAIQRRIDDMVHLPLPSQHERAGVLKLYRDRDLLNTKYNSKELIESVKQHLTDEKINEIAQRTNGLSNGDMSGIINTILTDTDSIVTPEIIETAVQRAIQKHNDWNNIKTCTA